MVEPLVYSKSTKKKKRKYFLPAVCVSLRKDNDVIFIEIIRFDVYIPSHLLRCQALL